MTESPASRLTALRDRLDSSGVEYEILTHAHTFHSAEEGAEGLGIDIAQMAPTFILHTERGPMAAIISGATRLIYKKIKKALGLNNVSLAAIEEVRAVTGCEPGIVSLVNPDIPTLIDRQLLEQEYAYGGCGVHAHTLKIRPIDLVTVTHAPVLDMAEDKASSP